MKTNFPLLNFFPKVTPIIVFQWDFYSDAKTANLELVAFIRKNPNDYCSFQNLHNFLIIICYLMNFFRGYFSLKKQKWSPDWFCPGVTPFVAPAYCNHAQEAYLKIKHNVDNCENHRWKVLKMNDNNALWRSPSWILDHHLGQIDCYNIQFLGWSADIFLLLTFIKHHIETWLEQNYLKIIPFFSSISPSSSSSSSPSSSRRSSNWKYYSSFSAWSEPPVKWGINFSFGHSHWHPASYKEYS